MLLFGYVVIHTFISVLIEKKYPKLEQGDIRLWSVSDASDDFFQK